MEQQRFVLTRYWINQPSTHHLSHRLHGKRVLAAKGYDGNKWDGQATRVYFVEGDIYSATILTVALSEGWPRDRWQVYCEALETEITYPSFREAQEAQEKLKKTAPNYKFSIRKETV